MNDELYMNRINRDNKYKQLLSRGYTKDQLHRSSTRNQLLHPMYVKDYSRPLTKAECSFGNTIYKTHFSVLYCLEYE